MTVQPIQWLTAPEDETQVRKHLADIVNAQYAGRADTDDLKTIYLFLTRKCNLGCQHCYIEGVGPKARDVDFNFETVRALIEQARPHGLRKVKVSGGEPMVHGDFGRILEYLGGIGLSEIVLETNGTLFKPDTVEFLATIPNLTVFISLDNFDAERHDAFRAKRGAFDKTTEVLRALGASAITSVVTTTAYRSNYDTVPSIIDMVLGWGIDKHRTLLNIHPLGNAKANLGNAITLVECDTLVRQIMATEHYRSGRAYLTLPPALTPLEQFDGVHTCGWGDNVLGLLSTGEVSMCSASYDDPNMIGGNAFDAPLIDIWRNSAFFKDLREISAGRVKGVCGNCVFYKTCRGVCKMSSYSHYGEKDAPYPLCQEAYNSGGFPAYALIDPDRDCTYAPGVIKEDRPPAEEPELYRFMRTSSRSPADVGARP